MNTNAASLLHELADKAASERLFFEHRYMPDDPRGQHPDKPGESVTKLPPGQRELLSHLRSEDLATVRPDVIALIVWPKYVRET